MSPFEPDPSRARAVFLAEEWRSASLASAWLRAGDWYGPAVDGMTQAFVTEGDLDSAAARLGAERATKGVSLSEGLDDLSVFYVIANGGEPPYGVGRAFAREWAEVTTAGLQARGCIDSLTGLTTLDYLTTRLTEVYGEETGVPETRCLVVVNGGLADLGGWQRVMRSSLLARIVRTVFDHGQTNTVLPSGTFVTLARRDDALAEYFVRLRQHLTHQKLVGASIEGDLPPVRLWIEPLPANAAHAKRLLFDL